MFQEKNFKKFLTDTLAKMSQNIFAHFSFQNILFLFFLQKLFWLRTGGCPPPPPFTYRSVTFMFFFWKREKECRMFRNGKICKNILWHFCKGICLKLGRISPFIFIKYWKYFSLEPNFSFIKTYVLDNSGSFDIHIEKK